MLQLVLERDRERRNCLLKMSQILPIIFILIFHIPRSLLSIEFNISEMCNVTSLKDFSCNIVLNSSHYYLTDVLINSFSVITNATITITATMDTAEIHCVNDSNYIASGVAFVNSSVFIERVSFNNCGAVINTLPYNIVNVLNNSHYVYYPSSYATAFMLINCIVDWYQVKFISSYGFAVVGFNLIDATFTECAFSSAKSFQVYGKLDIGSGLLIHYSDPSYHGPVTSHLVVNNCIFSHNFVVKNCSSNDHDMGNRFTQKTHYQLICSYTLLYPVIIFDTCFAKWYNIYWKRWPVHKFFTYCSIYI